MVKSSDKILSIMQKTACSEDIFFDLPAYVALLRSFDFWRIYDFYKNDRKAYLFSQIIMNPKFFSETDKVIADALFPMNTNMPKLWIPILCLPSEAYCWYCLESTASALLSETICRIALVPVFYDSFPIAIYDRLNNF